AHTPPAGDLSVARGGGGGGIHVVRSEPCRQLPACRQLRGSHLEGSSPGGPAGGAADEARAHNQPQDREGARSDNSTVTPATGGSGDRVMNRRAFLSGAAGAAILRPPSDRLPVAQSHCRRYSTPRGALPRAA